MTAPETTSLSGDHFARVFPFFLGFDREFRLAALGPSAAKLLHGRGLGEEASKIFRIRRPEGVDGLEGVLRNLDKLFLLEMNSIGCAMRGQFVTRADADRELLFLGSPWIKSPDELRPLGLRVSDFSLSDPTVDGMYLIQANTTALGELKQAESRLKRQRAELREANRCLGDRNEALQQQSDEARKLGWVARHTSNLVIITDRDGRVEWVNEAFTQVSGYRLEEVAGSKPGEILQCEESDPQTVQLMRERIAAGQGFDVEIVNRRKSGERYWVHIETQAIKGEDGRPTNFIAIETDISERKRHERTIELAREKAEAATRAKSEFLAMMSHEIRTPMNGILGMTGLLLETELDRRQVQFADAVKISAEALLQIINDILDFSRIEANKLRLEAQDFELRSMMDSIADLVAEQASRRGNELGFYCAADVPERLHGDDGRLRQVLVNLVSNAIKFTEQGDIVIYASVAERDRDAVSLQFEVKDTGDGISAEDQARLFQPFSQVDGSASRRHSGTGLGLAICKRIVRLMNGEIWVESAVGEGSRFQFTARMALARGERETDRRDGAAPERRPRAALIWSGRPAIARALEGMLADLGLAGVRAESPDGAARAFREAGVKGREMSLAFVDAPTAASWGASDLARARESADAACRWILVSSERTNSSSPQAAAGRFDAVLQKPVRYSDVAALLDAPARDGLTDQGGDRRSREAGLDPKSFPGMRVLVAEDHHINRKVALLYLRRMGIKADVASNGHEVLEAADRLSYDLIVMDCRMPEMDGYEAARQLRRRSAATRRGLPVQIIALTAESMRGAREECLAAGMDDYVSKPVRFETMAEAVEKAASRLGLADRDRSLEAPPSDDKDAADSAFARLSRELSPEAAMELLDDLIGDAPDRLSRVIALAADGNTEELARSAHSLKGCFQTFGAVSVSDMCEELELAARREAQPADLVRIARKLSQRYQSLEETLRVVMRRARGL